MENVKKFIITHKVLLVSVVLTFVFALVIGIPTLGKLRHRNSVYTVTEWDGSIASNYKGGTGNNDDPYIISNASEFAFFVEKLKTEDYQGKYFEISNDIVINSGLFNYENGEIKYILNNETYYLNETNNEYYATADKSGVSVGKINTLSSIKNFKGILNGNSYTIFGTYIYDFETEDLGIFKNLAGTIENIYFSNSVINGIGNVAGVAATTDGAVISNVSYDGYVINKSENQNVTNDLTDVSVLSNKGETKTSIGLPNVNVDGHINRVKFTGEWTGESGSVASMQIVAGEAVFDVDLTKNSFELVLGTNLLSEIFILTTSNIDGNSIEFSNLKYVVEYSNKTTSGIVAKSSNTTMMGVINKADVYGNYISSGIIGEVNGTLNISNSYNTGNVNSDVIGSGIIGEIKNNPNQINLNNLYNKGAINASLTSGIIGNLENNSGLIKVISVIELSNSYAINTINNSNIEISQSYILNGLTVQNGTTSSQFESKNELELYSKDFLVSIGYSEFVSLNDLETNESNVWIYENNSMPILYIDDLNNPIAKININKYSWDNLSMELDVIEIPKKITFNIESVSLTNPLTEIYYYYTTSRVALTKEELNNIEEWNLYNSPVTIEESGYYTIYVKAIDSYGKESYLNTDVMMLNVSGFQANITYDDNIWSDFRTDLTNLYINKDINFTIYAHNDLIPISSVEYFISDKELSNEEVKNITEWTSYVSAVTINELGNHIIYAKIVDADSAVRYINSDCLMYNGYTETLSIGNKGNNYNTNNISNTSSLNLTFESSFELEFKDGYTHNIISSVLLPKGTKITLKDKTENKIYGLKITDDEDLYGYNSSCGSNLNCSKYATYSFDLFKEVGTKDKENYNESINYGKTIKNEKYIVSIDLSDTVLTENYYDISFQLLIKDSEKNNLFTTLNNTVGNINIYSDINNSKIITTHKLLNNYSNQSINYNSNSEVSINFNNQLSYSSINDKIVIDTLFEEKKTGLLIGIYNSENKLISKDYLSSMLFEVNGKEYYPNSEGLIKINLGSVSDFSIKTLKIKTRENSNNLPEGSYYLKISNFISNDGYYYENLSNDELIIPVVLENQPVEIYNYNIFANMNGESIMLNKESESHIANFNVTYTGELIEPSVRISLYEKKDPSAYNQEYQLVDLKKYTIGELTEVASNQYLVNLENSLFSLNLDLSKFDYNGYKYVFELYDGSKKVSETQKYFIVK